MAKEMVKYPFVEFRDLMIMFNESKKITAKGIMKDELVGVIVFKQESFEKEYSLEARSYKVTNDNKGFIPGMFSSSIFGDALDGTDDYVRLDWYMYDDKDPWEVEYCYFL